jgi:hypothetical protein
LALGAAGVFADALIGDAEQLVALGAAKFDGHEGLEIKGLRGKQTVTEHRRLGLGI